MNHDHDPSQSADPSVNEYLRSLVPTPKAVPKYIGDIFLCTRWLPRYNLTWLTGDVIAGLTVGFVVIPQAMAYALLAGLTPEYGLYTSFVGAVLYWIFGSSKDIVIGTTAVGSLLVGSVVASVQEQKPNTYTNEDIAKALTAVSGLILLGIGLLRLGWIVEFIPYIPISAFVTAAAITIMSTQFPTLMGITGVNTRQATYRVIIDSLKGLPRTKIDAAIGLSSIVLLYIIRFVCSRMEKRDAKHQKTWAIVSSLRMTFAMLLYTLISWLVNRTNTGPDSDSPFRIVGHIERGFQHAGPPPLHDKDLVMLVLPELPAILIILVIEHIAIAKSFGRKYSYTVVPSQEILAQGASNLLGTFVGGYVCTGSFGASAVLSKAGSKTPIAGLVSAGILILALYALTAVFRYIPMAALAGLIIHAVLNLPTPPKTVLKYWRLSPLEFIIWWVGVLVAIFVSLEVSIYITICLSLAVYLVRQARAKGKFISSPHPGVFVYRFPAGLSYPNQAQHMGNLVAYIKAHTRGAPTGGNSSIPSWGEAVLPWSGNANKDNDSLPPLRAVVLDCTSIDLIDITSVQGLVDARDALDKHACTGRTKEEEKKCAVQWHFAGLSNPWARKTLARAGFGGATKGKKCESEKRGSANNEVDVEAARHEEHDEQTHSGRTSTEERSTEERSANDSGCENEDPLSRVTRWELERPLFHADLVDAVDSAVAAAEARR